MGRKIVLFVTICLLTLTIAASKKGEKNDNPQRIETINKQQSIEDVEESLKSLELAAKRVSRTKRANCLKAFGHAKFCDCLCSDLPMIVTFNDYIRIVTSSKEELGYDRLKADDKKVIDMVYSAREKCVGETLSTRDRN
ncbi:MAG: hypothetical protein AB1898_32675 [Acidobacteriota bacterium]